MRNVSKIICFLALLVSFTFAKDSFGGIGLSFKMGRFGAEVVEIIPETPAAKAKIRVGDVIIAADNVELKAKSSKDVQNLLRGVENKPVVISYVSEGDTVTTTLRRIQLEVEEVLNVESAEKKGMKLLSVLNKDKGVLSSNSQENLIGVYVKDSSEMKRQEKVRFEKKESAKLIGFSRNEIRVVLESSGLFSLTISTTDGDVVQRINLANGREGLNIVAWNGEKIPEGYYVVSIEYNSFVFGTSALLK